MAREQLERVIKAKIKLALQKQIRTAWFMPQAGVYGKSGIGDFVCCARGKYVEIEAKRVGKKQTPLQLQREQAVAHVGGSYFVVRTDDDLKKIIEFINS